MKLPFRLKKIDLIARSAEEKRKRISQYNGKRAFFKQFNEQYYILGKIFINNHDTDYYTREKKGAKYYYHDLEDLLIEVD